MECWQFSICNPLYRRKILCWIQWWTPFFDPTVVQQAPPRGYIWKKSILTWFAFPKFFDGKIWFFDENFQFFLRFFDLKSDFFKILNFRKKWIFDFFDFSKKFFQQIFDFSKNRIGGQKTLKKIENFRQKIKFFRRKIWEMRVMSKSNFWMKKFLGGGVAYIESKNGVHHRVQRKKLHINGYGPNFFRRSSILRTWYLKSSHRALFKNLLYHKKIGLVTFQSRL